MLRQITWGFVVGYIGLLALSACGASQLVECRLQAIRALPEDPEMVTVYDAIDTVKRLRACKVAGDAGP